MNSLAIEMEGNVGVRVNVREDGVCASFLFLRHPTGELEFSSKGSTFQGIVKEVPINHSLRKQARTALLLNDEIVLERV